MNPSELTTLKLLIRGFGVRVPGSAPVNALVTDDKHIPCSPTRRAATPEPNRLAFTQPEGQGDASPGTVPLGRGQP